MTKSKYPTKLIWTDLEMTGLDPVKDKIIEVAVIITDFSFNELATYDAVVKQPAKVLKRMEKSDWYDFSSGQRIKVGSVHDMLVKNGLMDRIDKEGKDENQVEQDLIGLVKDNFKDLAILAGNSIHQDRRFIRNWWPELEKLLHYRMLDVTSFKIWSQGANNLEYKKPEEHEHRALNDIRGSIQELKFYLKKLDLKPRNH